MRLIVKYFDQEIKQLEIPLTDKEAEMAKNLLLNGADFLKIGDEIINAKYIIGIFEGGEPPIEADRRIGAPKEKERDLSKIKKELEKIRKNLEEKGVLEKKNEFEKELEDEAKKLEEETAKEKHNEFIPERKLKEGEIDVNELPL